MFTMYTVRVCNYIVFAFITWFDLDNGAIPEIVPPPRRGGGGAQGGGGGWMGPGGLKLRPILGLIPSSSYSIVLINP